MSREYQKPPLVEALCEFQFLSENWDWTIPGIIYQQIGDRFKKKRQLDKIEFELKPQTKEIRQPSPGEAERIQFMNEDETRLVQVGPNMLAVNCVADYPHWDYFRDFIREMFTLYQSIAKPTAIKQIGLRYINRIEIPDIGFEFATYFNLEPKLPHEMPPNFETLFMRVELPYPSDSGLLILNFGSAPQKSIDQAAFILDLDFVTMANSNIPCEEYEGWLETAHTNIETAFEASITDQLRELFEEKKP